MACGTSSTKMAANISSYPSAFMLLLSKGGGIYFSFSNWAYLVIYFDQQKVRARMPCDFWANPFEALQLPSFALFRYSVHVKNLGYWILRNHVKRKRDTQPVLPQLKHQTCEWGSWILGPQGSSTSPCHVEQRWAIPRDHSPIGELWETINGCCFRVWNLQWLVMEQQVTENKALNSLPSLLLPLIYLSPQSQSSSPTELLRHQQWVMVFFAGIPLHVLLLFPECSAYLYQSDCYSSFKICLLCYPL